MMHRQITRRRFLKILAASSLCASSAQAATKGTGIVHRWKGAVLGATASLEFNVESEELGAHLVELSLREVQRLEQIFSLHLPNSSLKKLNRDGYLNNPPPELLELLDESARFSELSHGRFDVTIQPLWNYLYYRNGPVEMRRVNELKNLVNYRAVSCTPECISFERHGMQVTLNGIAQGYITDRVAHLLRAAGQKSVLVELGEIYALGCNARGTPWRIGIKDPAQGAFTQQPFAMVDLEDMAIATSGGYGMPIEENGELHHIVDPQTAKSPDYFTTLSVVSPSATWADGLSTALYLSPASQHERILAKYPGSYTVAQEFSR